MVRQCRIIVAFALIIGLPLANGTEVTRADDGAGTVQDAARQIALARDKANAAADAYFEAQSTLEVLGDTKLRLDETVADLKMRVAQLETSVEAAVVERYIGSNTTGIALLSGTVGPTDQAQTAELMGVINDASTISFDDYDELLKRVADQQAEAAKVTAAYEAAQADFKRKEQLAKDEIEQLRVVEQSRLNDEAVQHALEAQRQKDAESVAAAIAKQARVDRAAALAAALAAEGSGSDGGGEGIDLGNVASGSSAGGTTGGGGTGAHPTAGAIFGQGDAWLCPLQPPGTYGFSDTFGAPRSGGRLHQGVDMIAARGTQIVAVVDGVATAEQNTLGGNAITFAGNDGNRYYFAHLDSYGTVGRVTKGTVIGYVGDSGDAMFSTPHLHFEIHPGGGPAVNPTPTVTANC